MRKPSSSAVLGASLLCLACGDSSSSPRAELKVATYNLGLINSVGFVAERAPLAIAAAADLDVDVLCVQEVWDQEQWDELTEASAARRPNTLRLAPEPGAEGNCSPDLFNPLETCAAAACSESDNLVACVTASCAAEVAALDTGCSACLVENAPLGDFPAIREACVGSSDGSGERAYVQGGSYGIGLLSAKQLAQTDELKLDASTVRRAILYARIDDVHVFCTHLTAIQEGLRYEGSYGDWVSENAAHVQALIDWVDEKAGEDGKVIVLGDLNTGPAGDGITASFPENYAKLPDAGFENGFLGGDNAACTFCGDNPLVASDSGEAGAAIDHILTRGIRGEVSAERILDGLVEIEGDPPSSLPLSDHYGVQATLAP